MRIPLQDENRYLGFSGRFPTPFAPMYNKDEYIRALDEKETFDKTLNEVIQTEIIDKRSEKSVQTEVIKTRSENSIQTEVKGCHKNQSCRSQNEDGEINNTLHNLH